LTLFEYLSVAVSIVLSLSAAQILANVRAVLDPERRYWIHTLWVAIALYVHVIIWWEFWAFRDVPSWTMATFVLSLINPGVLFVASSALVVVGSDENRSWETHYFASRRSFFLAIGMLPLGAVLRDWLILAQPLAFPLHIPEVLMTLFSAIGWASGKKRVHGVLVLASMFTLAASTSYLWFQPGGGSGP
jgi:hypothetical protein